MGFCHHRGAGNALRRRTSRGFTVRVLLGTKLCPKCKQRKPVKGSTQTRQGQMVACKDCRGVRSGVVTITAPTTA
jgi:hypothetical protein